MRQREKREDPRRERQGETMGESETEREERRGKKTHGAKGPKLLVWEAKCHYSQVLQVSEVCRIKTNRNECIMYIGI